MTRRLLRFVRNEEGSVLIEATLLTPFLIVLVFGILEFSLYFYQRHLIETGVRDAARYLTRVDKDDSTVWTSAQTTARNLAATGTYAGGSARRVSGWNPDSSAIDISLSSVDNPIDEAGYRIYRGEATVTIVNVTGTFTYVPFGPLALLGLSSMPTVSVVHHERHIGPG